MAKGQPKIVYICEKCGFESPKWLGRCTECGSFNSFVQEIKAPSKVSAEMSGNANGAKNTNPRLTANRPQSIAKMDAENFQRLRVPIGEFERVMGGGIVPGSLTLISGDPGIGKSTLLLQVTAALAETLGNILYVSAEESANQIKLRAERLGLAPEQLYLLSETNLNLILDHIQEMQPALVVIDSIQTVYLSHKERNIGEDEPSFGFGYSGFDELGGEMTAAAGSVTQVRECTSTLMRLAKKTGIPCFLVGHVTKEGNIAGPRVLEHMVDTVLYLEGDRYHQYRLLRGVKNRFGSTNEVGVFEMKGEGLAEVSNPSQAFLAERMKGAPGSAVAVTMEGTRPILVEVQALCSQCYTQMPRRTPNGIDMNRLLLLSAVLSKRVGVPLGNQDVYVNVVGGLKINEPAVDLSTAAAIASSFQECEIDPNTVLIGEVGLSGEIRMVSHVERRIAEAAKLGFTRAIYPKPAGELNLKLPPDFQAVSAATLAEALEKALVPHKNEEGTAKNNKRQGRNNNTKYNNRNDNYNRANAIKNGAVIDEFGNDLLTEGDAQEDYYLEPSDLDEF
jgi:DNA repair protein RadA/Sms